LARFDQHRVRLVEAISALRKPLDVGLGDGRVAQVTVQRTVPNGYASVVLRQITIATCHGRWLREHLDSSRPTGTDDPCTESTKPARRTGRRDATDGHRWTALSGQSRCHAEQLMPHPVGR
jgi:hypothetical protein